MNKDNTVEALTTKLNITRPELVRYAKCYNIDLMSFCIKPQSYFGTYLELYDDAFEFFQNKKEEIKTHNSEFTKFKKVKELCDNLGLTIKEFSDFYNLHHTTINLYWQNTSPIFMPSNKLNEDTKVKYISTQFLLHLINGFPLKTTRLGVINSINEENLGFNDIIGYHDFKSSIIDLLNPIKDSKALDLWGLRKPGGIILFGPPGCGKTFWATKISEYIQYDFKEIPRSSFASSLVDGATKNLKELLDGTQSNTALFFDEFDSIAETRSNKTSGSQENIKVVNTLLQEIPKLISRDIILIAATNYLTRIDSAVIRPGRFDLKIPIFPPNIEERAEIIYQKFTKDLQNKSPLAEIIKTNEINDYKYFIESAKMMELFSSSLLEDFVDTLKRSLKEIYDKGASSKAIRLNKDLINMTIAKTKSKIVQQDLEILSNFYLEVNSLTGSEIYNERLTLLKSELSNSMKNIKDPPKPIGYRQPKI